MLSAILSFLSSYALVFVLHVMGAGTFPKPLSPKQEQEQLRLLKEGDRAARNTLIEHNLRLVAHIVKKYSSGQSDQDDLVSIGTIGLIKAIDTFDSDKKIRLSRSPKSSKRRSISKKLTKRSTLSPKENAGSSLCDTGFTAASLSPKKKRRRS